MMVEGAMTSAMIAYQMQSMDGLQQATDEQTQNAQAEGQAAVAAAAQISPDQIDPDKISGPPPADGKGVTVDMYV